MATMEQWMTKKRKRGGALRSSSIQNESSSLKGLNDMPIDDLIELAWNEGSESIFQFVSSQVKSNRMNGEFSLNIS